MRHWCRYRSQAQNSMGTKISRCGQRLTTTAPFVPYRSSTNNSRQHGWILPLILYCDGSIAHATADGESLNSQIMVIRMQEHDDPMESHYTSASPGD